MTGSLLLRLREYTKNSDPLAQIAGTIGIVIAGNQPFYPLYLHAIAGSAAWPSWLTLFSTPFFVAVPALARRNSVAGRAMLLVAGVANTVLCVKMLGSASGVELFLFPCVLLATILFRWHERFFMVPLLLLTFLVYLLIDTAVGPAVKAFNADEYAAMVRLNAISVSSLLALIGYLFASIGSTREQ